MYGPRSVNREPAGSLFWRKKKERKKKKKKIEKVRRKGIRPRLIKKKMLYSCYNGVVLITQKHVFELLKNGFRSSKTRISYLNGQRGRSE
jgi:hypothetical protein